MLRPPPGTVFKLSVCGFQPRGTYCTCTALSRHAYDLRLKKTNRGKQISQHKQPVANLWKHVSNSLEYSIHIQACCYMLLNESSVLKVVWNKNNPNKLEIYIHNICCIIVSLNRIKWLYTVNRNYNSTTYLMLARNDHGSVEGNKNVLFPHREQIWARAMMYFCIVD